MDENKKIAYVVTPNNFETWCIYYYVSDQFGAKVTSHMSGYGKEKLTKELKGNEVILRTDGADLIDFVIKHNNKDVNGESNYDINLSNEDYIKGYIKNGAVQITI